MSDMNEIAKPIGVKIVVDGSEFTSGLKKAEGELSNFSGDVKNGGSSLKDYIQAMDEAGRTADDTASDVNGLSKEIKNEGDEATKAADRLDKFSGSVSTANKETEKLRNGISKTNENFDDAKTPVSNLDDLLSDFGKGFSVATIISLLNDVINKAKETAKEVENSYYEMAVATGTISEDYQAVVDSLRGLVPGTPAELGKGLGVLETRNGDMSSNDLKALLGEYASFNSLMGGDLTSTIRSTDNAFSKWGIEGAKEQMEALSQLRVIVEKTDVDYSTLINTLGQSDRELQLSGMNFVEAASAIGSAELTGDVADILKFTEAIDRVAKIKAADFGSDEELQNYIESLIISAKETKSEAEAAKVLADEFGLVGNAATSMAAYIWSSSDALDANTVVAEAAITSNKQWYNTLETVTQAQEKAAATSSELETAIGSTANEIDKFTSKAEIWEKKLYNFVGIPSLDLGAIPVLGEYLSGIKTPAIGIELPNSNYYDNLKDLMNETISQERYDMGLRDNGDIDWMYYNNLKDQAKVLNIDYSDLKLLPGSGLWMEQDVAAGKYDVLAERIKDTETALNTQNALLEEGAGKQITNNVTVTQYISAPVYDTTQAQRSTQLAAETVFNNPTYH